MRHQNSKPRSAQAGAALLALGTCLTSPSQAQEATETVLGVTEIVTATRSGGAVDDSPRAVSVVDGETIRERPAAAGIQELLAEVPGIQFSRSGGLGGQIVMRGFNSNATRSIVTVDGDRYRGRSTLEFNMFDPNGIERIEVIRGPASALYGADAMNGVVNIVTRRARVDRDQPFVLAPRLRALEYASVNDLWGGRVELAGGGQGFDVLIGAHARSAGDYDTPVGKAYNSAFETKGVDFNIGYRPTNESRWEISGRYENAKTERAGGLGAAPGEPVLSVSEKPITERYLRLGYQGRNFGAVADSLDASMYVRKFDTHIWQTNRANPAMTVDAHIRVDAPTVWGGHLVAMKAVDDHLLSYGADFFSEDFEGRNRQITRSNNTTGTVTPLPWEKIDRDSKTTNIGIFVADEWRANERWVLSGAVRGDWVKAEVGGALANENAAQRAAYGRNPGSTETALTGSMGAVFALDEVWSVAANLSRGFRAPSGMDMTITSTAGTITTLPSPDLSPEVNRTVELGLRWASARHQGSVTAYQSNYRDLITTTVVSPTLRQRQNVSKAVIRSLELEGRSLLDRNFSLNYMLTATRGTDESESRPLPGIAPLSGRLALRYTHGGWYAESVLRGYKGRSRIDKTQERGTASYAMVDLHAGTRLDGLLGESWKGWKVVAGIENLFDRAGRNPTVAEDIAYPRGTVGNPLVEPGRNFAIKLSSDF
ncbi:TonB-dependent receptor [Thauera sp.]|uniref:TonB-dependent receptor n=1 Tax=Thauera sp. TaxID=1905334 RepID=UPI0039E33DFA